MKNNNLLDKEEIKGLINDSLYTNGLISEELYEKCGKPHISSLPHDLRNNDKVKLQQRKDVIIDKWNEIDNEIISKNYPKEFWEIGVNIDLYMDDDRRGKDFYNGDRVVEYYDNLLNATKDLNDVIRDYYDNQINNLKNNIKEYKNNVLSRNKYQDELIDTKEKLEKNISNNTKELRKENRKLDSLELELNKQQDLLNQYNDHKDILDEFNEQLSVNWRDYVDYDDNGNYMIDAGKLNQINPQLYSYISETFKLYRNYKDGRDVNVISNNIDSTRDTIYQLNFNIDSDRRNVVTQDELIRKEQKQIDYNINQINQSENRIKYLRKNKPNKSQKDNNNYNELVNKKNLAISFKNDINKIHDYQNELVKVNNSLNIDDVWDGIPKTEPTSDYILGRGY